jgi:hypothetical protein
MTIQRIAAVALTAILLTGCAAHHPPRTDASAPPPEGDDQVGSVVANIWYTPGRALMCGASAVGAGLVMMVTFGQSYDTASELMHGGCSGPWILRAADIRQAVP